jgi:hypothetical protein
MVRTHKTSSSWQSTGHCSAGYNLSGGANLKNENSKALLLSLIDLLPGQQKMEIHQTDAKSLCESDSRDAQARSSVDRKP